jgi:hypothetical protein
MRRYVVVLNAAVGPQETAIISYSVGGAITVILIAFAVFAVYSLGGGAGAAGAAAAPTLWRPIGGNVVTQDRPFFGVTPRFNDARPWRMLNSPSPVSMVGAANPMARAYGYRPDALNRLYGGKFNRIVPQPAESVGSQPPKSNMTPWRFGQYGDPANVRLYWRPRSAFDTENIASRPAPPMAGPAIRRPPVAGLPTAGLSPRRFGFGHAPWAMPRYTGADQVQHGLNNRFQVSQNRSFRSPPAPQPRENMRPNPLPNIVSDNCL